MTCVDSQPPVEHARSPGGAGVSPTSPSSGSGSTISSLGSGTNENQFLIDGTNGTCPCNGVARSEAGVDFIQEIQIQAVGASAEFGNMQGAVVNVITGRAASGFSSSRPTTGNPPRDQPARAGEVRTPAARERLHPQPLPRLLVEPRRACCSQSAVVLRGLPVSRDYDSQPGTDPPFPAPTSRTRYSRNSPGIWRRVEANQSFHQEFWVSGEPPTVHQAERNDTRRHASVPAMTFGHLTHTASPRTLWDVRVGRFVYSQEEIPAYGGYMYGEPPDADESPVGGPQTFRRRRRSSGPPQRRRSIITGPACWAPTIRKVGGQFERGEHTAFGHSDRHAIPTTPSSATFSDPLEHEGVFLTTWLRHRRLHHRRPRHVNAGSASIGARRSVRTSTPSTARQRNRQIINGLGTLYTWNLCLAAAGVTIKLTANGRTMFRGSYGRFIRACIRASSALSILVRHDQVLLRRRGRGYTAYGLLARARNLYLDPGLRAPRTDESTVGMDRAFGRRSGRRRLHPQVRRQFHRLDGRRRHIGRRCARFTTACPCRSSSSRLRRRPGALS